jgi:hypothetical protein
LRLSAQSIEEVLVEIDDHSSVAAFPKNHGERREKRVAKEDNCAALPGQDADGEQTAADRLGPIAQRNPNHYVHSCLVQAFPGIRHCLALSDKRGKHLPITLRYLPARVISRASRFHTRAARDRNITRHWIMNGGEPTRISIIFSFKRERPHRRVGCCKLRRVMAGDAKDCYAKEPGMISLSSSTCFPLNSGRSRRTRQHAV